MKHPFEVLRPEYSQLLSAMDPARLNVRTDSESKITSYTIG